MLQTTGTKPLVFLHCTTLRNLQKRHQGTCQKAVVSQCAQHYSLGVAYPLSIIKALALGFALHGNSQMKKT